MDALARRQGTQLSRRGFLSTLGKVAAVAGAVAAGVTVHVADKVQEKVSASFAEGTMPLIMTNYLHGLVRSAVTK